jgi:signal transduction histidine kinase
MNPYAVPPLFSAALFSLIGLITLYKSESTAKAPFVTLCFLTVIWQLSWTVLFNVNDVHTAASVIKFGYSGIIFIPLVYYHFIVRFCNTEKSYLKTVYAVGGLFLLVHMFSDWYIAGFYTLYWGYYPKAGVLHPFYLLFITITLFAAMMQLKNEWVSSKNDPLRHQQVKWVTLSFGLYYLAATDFLINYGMEFYPFGVVFILTSLAIIAYSIAKYQLLQINVVLKKTVFYSSLLFLLIAPCLTVIYLNEKYVDSSYQYLVYSLMLVLVGFIFPRIKLHAEHTLENLLFGKKVNYQETFEKLSETLAHLKDLDVLLKEVVDTIAEAVNTQSLAIYLLGRSDVEYELTACYGDKQKYTDVIELDSVNFAPRKVDDNSRENDLKITNLDSGSFPVPIVYEDVLIGIMLISDCRNDNEYEAKALSAMANQLAVAINNSLQIRHIKQLNIQLEEKVNERTRELRSAYDELKRRSKYQEEFFSRVSHELRTPLTNIMVPLYSVLEDYSDILTADNRREKESMLRNASILLKRINDILDIAKLKSGKMQLHVRRTDISEVLGDVILAVSSATELGGPIIDYTAVTLTPLFLDKDKVEQIFLNIISNAIKFTDKKGVIKIQLAETGETTTVSISDNGCGIEPEEIENIFTPFYQTAATTKRGYKGTGLGLAICREFMELHHGRITVKSQLGAGTQFDLEFRHGTDHFADDELVKSSDQQQPVRKSNNPGSMDLVWTNVLNVVDPVYYSEARNANILEHKKRILIIEDDIDLANNIVRIFNHDYHVNTAWNGAEGLQIVREFKPDVIISDIMMPQMDGLTICETIKNNPDTKDMLVILLTANMSIETKVEGLNAGADYYLQKPFFPKELFAVVRSLLIKREYQHQIMNKNKELEQIKDQLQESIRVADQANEAKSVFLANMSHEIRTPLTAIMGFAEYLQGANRTPENVNRAVSSIHNSSVHLLEVINDILDISKIEANRVELEYTTISPLTVVSEVVDIISHRAANKGLEIKTDIHYPFPKHIRTDPTRLRQILLNLCGNAVKFTDTGSITIRMSYLANDRLIKYEVIDTGIGLREEEKDRIFKPFTQADSSTTRRFGGTGLGLTLSRQLAELLGGTVVCSSSQVGQGSTFTVTVFIGDIVPLELVHNTEKKQPDIATQDTCVKPTLSGTILLVDDVELIQQLISLRLNSIGLKPVVASHGEMAVELVRQQEFDLILMDLQMPVMDGLTAIKQIRKLGYSKPIIALTANTLKSERIRCLNAGADDFLPKPIDFNLFFEMIAHYLSDPRTETKPHDAHKLHDSQALNIEHTIAVKNKF